MVNRYVFPILAIFIIALASNGALGQEDKEELPPVEAIATNCGDVLTVEKSGRIIYKADRSYGRTERCTFIVRMNSARSIRFHLDYQGFDYIEAISADGRPLNLVKLSLVTLNYRQGANIRDIIIQSYPRMTKADLDHKSKDALLDGNVAIITFATHTWGMNDHHFRGFVLSLYAAEEATPYTSIKSIDMVRRDLEGTLTYPLTNAPARDLSTFLFFPNVTYSEPLYTFRFTSLVAPSPPYNSRCWERIDIYTYRIMETGGWAPAVEKICLDKLGDDKSVEVKIPSSLVLMSFLTNCAGVISACDGKFQLDYAYGWNKY